MGYVVFATHPAVEEVPPSPWTGLRITWQGWDGSSWDLTDAAGGVFLTSGGITGLHMPQFDQYVDEYANVDGGVYRGSRAQVRNPEFALHLWDDGSTAGFKALYQAVWNTFHPDRPGLLTVTDIATGEKRSLVARLRSAEELSYTRDPMQAGWADYLITLLAEDPYWRGTPVVSPIWGQADPTNFTGPSDSAPPLYISGATSVGTASLTNPGDVDAPLFYTFTGGTSGGLTAVAVSSDATGSLGYGAVVEGSVLKVSTDPVAPIATLNGTDVTGAVNPWDPWPLPAGETTQLGITLTGQGTAQASFTPRYYRAF